MRILHNNKTLLYHQSIVLTKYGQLYDDFTIPCGLRRTFWTFRIVSNQNVSSSEKNNCLGKVTLPSYFFCFDMLYNDHAILGGFLIVSSIVGIYRLSLISLSLI